MSGTPIINQPRPATTKLTAQEVATIKEVKQAIVKSNETVKK